MGKFQSIREKWLQPREKKEPFMPSPDKEMTQAQEMKGMEEELMTLKARFDDGSLDIKQDPGQAKAAHFKDILALENSSRKGLVKSSTGNRWMPIVSGEGRGPDKKMSNYEIGHGIKIPESWLGNDQSKWPTAKGVKINVREGMTEDQEQFIVRDLLDKSYEFSSRAVKGWEDLTENTKVFWGDLTYNGGHGAIKKNPKAKKAQEAGFPVESMVLALDYIGSGGKPSRGLLNRRVSMFNQAASEIPGAPLIEEYKFGDKIQVRFAHGFMTDKVSDAFVNEQGDTLWRTLVDQEGRYEGKEISKKMDKEQKFRE